MREKKIRKVRRKKEERELKKRAHENCKNALQYLMKNQTMRESMRDQNKENEMLKDEIEFQKMNCDRMKKDREIEQFAIVVSGKMKAKNEFIMKIYKWIGSMMTIF